MAMLYTPQQLAGGAKYSRGVRVGNWYEDIDYADTKVKDYVNRRANGQLPSTQRSARANVLQQPVPHSFSGDGSVKYGDSVLLRNQTEEKEDDDPSPATGAVVTSNPFAEISFGTGDTLALGARAGADVQPQAQNTVVITQDKEAAAEGKSAGGDTLCFGDSFYLCTNPSLRCDPRTMMLRPALYLTSRKKGLNSGLSGKQGTTFTMQKTTDARWKVEPLDQRRKVVFEGKPVPANEPVLLRHVNSNQLLACSAECMEGGEKGGDFSLIAHSFSNSTARTANAVSAENHWKFVTSSSPDAAVDNRQFMRMTPELILQKVRETINKRGAYAIRGLARSFKIMDDAGDGMLDTEDFKWGLSDYGVQLGDDEFAMVMNLFDANGDGFVSFDEFLRTLRGPMPERRMAFVKQAYGLLDRTGDGVVDIQDMKAIYDCSQHPDVIAGKKSTAEVLEEFMTQWDKGGDGVVSMKEFATYYEDVSASIDSDDYFELMMRNAWHISGGEGQMANTTCRRVMVIHTDGSQTIEEIKNDLGVKDDDKEEMIRRLKQQGITDIVDIKLSG